MICHGKFGIKSWAKVLSYKNRVNGHGVANTIMSDNLFFKLFWCTDDEIISDQNGSKPYVFFGDLSTQVYLT